MGRTSACLLACVAACAGACARATRGADGRGGPVVARSTAVRDATGEGTAATLRGGESGAAAPANEHPDGAAAGPERDGDPAGARGEAELTVHDGERLAPTGADDAIPAADEPPEAATPDSPAPPDGGAAACLGDPPSDPAPWVIGYYVRRRRSPYAPEKIQWRALTHLAVGPAVPRADGSLDTSSLQDEGEAEDTDPTRSTHSTHSPHPADDLVVRAHAAGVGALLFVGGGETHDAWAAAAADELRAGFVAALVRWARDEHGFDGLDLDWEPMRQADHDDFRSLAEDLRAAWPEAILTVPVVHHNVNLVAIDPFWAKVAPLFDRIDIMSYGMAGEYPGWLSWHASALHGAVHDSPTSIADSVEAYLAAGVPAAKLGIGIGFYGVCYTPPVAGPREELRGGRIAAADVDMSYRNIMTRYFESEAWRWDDEAKSPYLSFVEPKGPMGCGYISYEDARSIAERAAYVKAKGLGGAIVWSIEQGYLPREEEGARDPLMDALAACFLGR
ncbi:MAG: hypothetical protein HY905_17470 [Deltaproteobacteria bacterium]|nr:hypothetical protein [Deltaproteobacteria bacterium]